MNLKEYLFYSEMTIKEFALIADISPCHLSSVMTKQRPTTPKLLRAIARASKNKVTAETIFAPIKKPDDWLDEEGDKAA